MNTTHCIVCARPKDIMIKKTEMNQSNDIQFQQEVFEIIGAAMEVQNELGLGFSELVYHEALNIELGLRNIP